MSPFRKIAVLIPCYKRPEYTELCLESVFKQKYDNVIFYIVDEGGNKDVIMKYARSEDVVSIHAEPRGLRNTIIEFFDWIKEDGPDFKYIAKVDNDCAVPDKWVYDLHDILVKANADILSPNTSETNAAYKYGFIHRREGDFIPSRIVGGLWFMRRDMIDDIFFEKVGTRGIRAAFHIINQIVVEKSPKIGWTDKVTYEDVGYWTGSHPDHIKSFDHAMYSVEIGRRITWSPENEKANV